MFDIELSDCTITDIYTRDYCGVSQSYITFYFSDGFVFETNCEETINPIKFHRFITQKFSHLDRIHFCLGFVKNFSCRNIQHLEMCNSKMYNQEGKHVESVDMSIHIGYDKINKIIFEYLQDYVQFITFMFSDGDYIRYEVDLTNYPEHPVNFFRYIEMLESCCGTDEPISKEILLKKIASKQRFVVKQYRTLCGYYIMNCSLNKVNKGVSLFFTRHSVDWNGTTYTARYIEREMPLDVNTVDYSEIKTCLDADMRID